MVPLLTGVLSESGNFVKATVLLSRRDLHLPVVLCLSKNVREYKVLEGLSVTNPRPRVYGRMRSARKAGMTTQPEGIELSLSLLTSLILRVAMPRLSSVDIVPYGVYSLQFLVPAVCKYLPLQEH